MNKIEYEIKHECDRYLSRNKMNESYMLNSVYYNPTDPKDVVAHILSIDDESMFVCNPYENKEPDEYPDWDYNIDSYDFEKLSNGYEIAYISMSTHYNIWSTLENWLPDEIENKVGLQKYLTHCKENDITKSIIEYANSLPLNKNIMDYYKNKDYLISKPTRNYER